MIDAQSDLVTHIYDQIDNKLTSIYQWYMESYNLETKFSMCLPPKNKQIKNIIYRNHVGPIEILRIDIQTPLISIRTKCLYNIDTSESFINMIDFAMHKIQLRSGGFGSKIINSIFELQQLQLQEEYGINPSTKMAVFKFLSIPFQLKNDFAFHQMIDEHDDDNNQNITYKFFKLFIIMNKIQYINSFVQNFELFSLDAPKVDDVLRRQTFAFYSSIFNENLQLKNKVLDRVGSKTCEDFATSDKNFCTNVIYKNICNQLANDKIYDHGIMNILQELFYLERLVGRK